MKSEDKKAISSIGITAILVIPVFAAFSLFAIPVAPVSAGPPATEDYGGLTLSSPFTATHWDDVWDLTQCDLNLSYTIDMNGVTPPDMWQTSYTEVGIRQEGAGDFNPGPWDTYQGGCGGFMAASAPCAFETNPESLDLDDKFNLQASGGRGEKDYDVLYSDPDTVTVPPIGSFNNYGIWFDRDGVDQWQAGYWGRIDGGNYNTGGTYEIVITYHAINPTLGTMFATVNGIQQGFIAHTDAPPDYYPAGLSFTGDMTRMQVFAGLWAPDDTYGDVIVSNLTVDGCLGVSDPLIADFTFSPPICQIYVGDTVQFTDATSGGMPPYCYSWDLDGDGVEDSTARNPTWTYDAAGDYEVTLTVKGGHCWEECPACCEKDSVTKTVRVHPPVPVPEFSPIGLAAFIGILSAMLAVATLRKRK